MSGDIGLGRLATADAQRDAAGVQHRVHGGCVEGSVADGNKLVPQREKHWADDIPMGDVFGVCSVLQGSKK